MSEPKAAPPLPLSPNGGNPDETTKQSTKPASGQVAAYLPQAGEGANAEPKPKSASPSPQPSPLEGEGANAEPKPINESPFKGKTGLTRILNAAGYSWAGLRAAFRHEDAFRQEVFLLVLLVPLALYLGDNGIERALMIASLLLVLIVELLNSSVEAAVDRVSLELHPLIKRAKDMGSAAVMISLLNVVVVWLLVVLG
jgi:diacylglycerol kinase (ATP)